MSITKKTKSTPSDTDRPPGLRRLHKILSAAGVCSLREGERLIAEGRVSVNGEIVTQKGAMADPDNDAIRVDGKIIKTGAPKIYLAVYKPKGYVTTRKDEKGRKTVMDIVPKDYASLYPVGRLDLMSEGLILLTNDGAFAQTITAPKSKIKKIYRVKVRNVPDGKALAKMRSGITLEGEKLRADSAKIIETTGRNCWLEVVLTEGKKRHIRRLFQALGFPVLKLKRIAIGSIKLGDLKPGEAKHVKIEQVNKIMKAAGRDGKK